MSSDVNTDLLEETKTSLELAQVWKVVVLNDPVNLMNYVVMVFRKIFGYGEQKAIKHMKEVHELGKSVLWSGEQEERKAMCISYKNGDCKQCWKKMIDFQLQIDSRILQAILPQLEKTFALACKRGGFSYSCPNPMDDDFVEAWEVGLKQDFSQDRKALAILFRNPKFNMDILKCQMMKWTKSCDV